MTKQVQEHPIERVGLNVVWKSSGYVKFKQNNVLGSYLSGESWIRPPTRSSCLAAIFGHPRVGVCAERVHLPNKLKTRKLKRSPTP